ISYQMNLYEPIYIPRPFVEPEYFASLRPPVYTGALEPGKEAAQGGEKAKMPPAQGGQMFGGQGMMGGLPGGLQGYQGGFGAGGGFQGFAGGFQGFGNPFGNFGNLGAQGGFGGWNYFNNDMNRYQFDLRNQFNPNVFNKLTYDELQARREAHAKQ